MRRPYSMNLEETIAWFWNNCSEDKLIIPELGPCRVFTQESKLDQKGYVRVSWDDGKRRLHSLALELKLGRPPVPCALHHCDVRSCFRPQHLYEGTNYDNIQDRVERDRGNRPNGSLNHFATLTEEDVKQIRQRLEQGETGAKLAKEYGVQAAAISKIRLRRSWRHI